MSMATTLNFSVDTHGRSRRLSASRASSPSRIRALPRAMTLHADSAVSAGYGSSGERCMAVSVVVAGGSIADPLVDAIAERLPSIQVGTGTGGASEMGPLITKQHKEKVASYIAAIPALLEVALVFFLVGLLVFVPTYADSALTAAVSVAIGAILVGTAVLTVLPVFYRLCPFQSPTG